MGEEEQIVTVHMEKKMNALTAMTPANNAHPVMGMVVSIPGAHVASHTEQLKDRHFMKESEWDPYPNKTDYNNVFFNHFSPSLGGRTQVDDHIMLGPCCGV